MKTKLIVGESVNTKVKSSVSDTLLLSLYCSIIKLACRPVWESVSSSITSRIRL